MDCEPVDRNVGRRGSEHICVAEDRLVNIENWLAKLSNNMEQITSVFVALAKLETTISALTCNNADHETRMRNLERTLQQNHTVMRWVERTIWTVLVTGVAYFGGFI